MNREAGAQLANLIELNHPKSIDSITEGRGFKRHTESESICLTMPGYNLQAPPKEVGETIPSDSPHAVSVTLPTWDSNVAYEEGEEWVHSKMKSGYPRYNQIHIMHLTSRFMIHEKIQEVISCSRSLVNE